MDAGGDTVFNQSGQRPFRFLFARQMKWKGFEVFAISAETALRGQRRVLPPSDFCGLVRRFIGIHSGRVRKMGRLGDSPAGGATPQLRRSDLFVADGSHPAKSPVEAASSALMPLLRSFDFLPFVIYKYAAPMGLGKATLALNSMAASQWSVLRKKRLSGHAFSHFSIRSLFVY